MPRRPQQAVTPTQAAALTPDQMRLGIAQIERRIAELAALKADQLESDNDPKITTMQVAISVVAACLWMIDNPQRGVCVPDDLPHDFVLKISRPYLGTMVSVASDWTPLKHGANAFEGFNGIQPDRSDPWQFRNFLITEGD